MTILHLIFPLLILLTINSFVQQGKPAIPEEEGKKQWEQFAAIYNDRAGPESQTILIRQNIQEGLELTPLPAKTALHPIAWHKKIMEGHTVENAAFENKPGFWVTGNLYRPLKIANQMPGILCPTGHSSNPEQARRDSNCRTMKNNDIDKSFITILPYQELILFTPDFPRPSYAVMG